MPYIKKMNRIYRIHNRVRNWRPVAAISLALPTISYGTLVRDVCRLSPVRLARPIVGSLRERSFGESAKYLAQAVILQPTLPLLIAILALAFCAPTLASGFREDDDLMHRNLLLNASLPQVMRGLFVFFDPSTTPVLMDQGIFPWWSLPEARIAFFRPLAGLTH
jgi:hypothetical protein